MAVKALRVEVDPATADTVQRDAALIPKVQGLAGEQIELARAILALTRSGTIAERPEAIPEIIRQEKRLFKRTQNLLQEHPELPPEIAATIENLASCQREMLAACTGSSDRASEEKVPWLADIAGTLRSLALKVSFASLDHVINHHIVADGRITREELQDLFDLIPVPSDRDVCPGGVPSGSIGHLRHDPSSLV